MSLPSQQGERQSVGREWVTLLIALLLSFACIFLATFLALLFQPTELQDASMLAQNRANYGGEDGSSFEFARVDPRIIVEATSDATGLQVTRGTVRDEPDLSATESALPTATSTPRPLPPPPITTGPNPTQTSRPSREPTSANTPRPLLPADTATPVQPSATTVPSQTPTASVTSTARPTVIAKSTPSPSPFPTVRLTITATATWTPSPPPPPTQPPPPLPTDTPVPPTVPPPTATKPRLPTPTNTATLAPTATPTSGPPPTASATPTATASQTPTSTATPTNTPTQPPTATSTPTSSPTPTNTATPTGPPPCSGGGPAGEPNVGPPNGAFFGVACGSSLVLDLGVANPLVVPHAGYDLAYYERENPPGFVLLDWVIVEIGPTSTGPWIQVFYWGDGIPDANSNVAGYSGGPGGEVDNEQIPLTDLYGVPPYQTGVAIDVDVLAGPGTYQWVRITSPLGGGNDASEVDAIEVLP